MKNFKQGVLLGLALLLLSGMVHAVNWVQIEGAPGITVQLDPVSIVPAGEGLIKAWVQHSYAEDQYSRVTPVFKFRSSIQLYLFNCAERTLGTIQDVFYSQEYGLGDTVDSNLYPRKSVPLMDVIPGTLGESTLNFACAFIKRKNKK